MKINALLSQPKLLVGLLCGFLLIVFAFFKGDSPKDSVQDSQSATQVWTCSMHPQIQLPQFGQCPICAMDLIPLAEGSDEGDERRLVLSPTAQKLAKIHTTPVMRKWVSSTVRVTGKVAYDETQLSYITSWVSGRIDRLYVDYTGVAVRKGDHMALIYSPELLAAQEEFLQAMKSIENVKQSHLELMKTTSQNTLNNAQQKLKLLGITDQQIEKLRQTQSVSEHMTIYASTDGVVLSKEQKEGAYVKTGSRLYRVANLEKLWVVFDVYESDLPWVHYGQSVTFETEAYPGELFEGVVSFVSPVVSEQTRTISVRINVQNEDGRLKPGMFVRGQMSASLSSEGEVFNDFLAGKWISPMHPEIVKDSPGQCDVCGMDLVPAESLGFQNSEGTPPLVIPHSAPLITGTRAIVYVATANEDKLAYEGREVILGPRLGDYYVVYSGLKEGEDVVSQGNFKIDSAIQIKAGQSMMNVHDKDNSSAQLSIPQSFASQLMGVYDQYFVLQKALAEDRWEEILPRSDELIKYVNSINSNSLMGETEDFWSQWAADFHKTFEHLAHVSTIKAYRKMIFESLSNLLIRLEKTFGHSSSETYYEMFCPMAFDNEGASWLQNKQEVENSYFGEMMFACGAIEEKFLGQKKPRRHQH